MMNCIAASSDYFDEPSKDTTEQESVWDSIELVEQSGDHAEEDKHFKSAFTAAKFFEKFDIPSPELSNLEATSAKDVDLEDLDLGGVDLENIISNSGLPALPANAPDLVGTAEHTEMRWQPDACGTCCMCRKNVYNVESASGDVWGKDDAYLENGKCPHCGYNTVHLGCALGSLFPIKCYSCGKDMHQRSSELDVLIIQLQRREVTSKNARAHLSAFDSLESMQHSLIVSTLHTYDMTADELGSLNAVIKYLNNGNSENTRYPKIVHMVSSLQWIKFVARAHAMRELLDLVTDSRAFAMALPVLGIVITPHLIAKATESQIMMLIEFFGGYKGFYTEFWGCLINRVANLFNIVRTVPFNANGTERMLNNLIDLDGCAVIKYLLGRRNFSHWLANKKICAIIERYASKCTYRNETFVPLLIYLINGHTTNPFMTKRFKCFLEKFLMQGGGEIDAKNYLRGLLKRRIRTTKSMADIIAGYKYNGWGFNLSEDIFFCVTKKGQTIENCLFCMEQAINHKEGGAHIFRHMPNAWMRNDAGSLAKTLEQAIAQGNFPMLEEILIASMNLSQAKSTVLDLLKILLANNCLDYAGLVLRIDSSAGTKLKNLNDDEMIGGFLNQMVENNMHWCIPYFKTIIRNKGNYNQMVSKYHQEIIDSAVAGSFRFSLIFRKMIQYTAENTFFIRHLPDYLEALLRASTDRHVVQRLLIEICSTRLFTDLFTEKKMAAICEIFSRYPDQHFYLDAFYHALLHASQKDCLEAVVLKNPRFHIKFWPVQSAEAGTDPNKTAARGMGLAEALR